MEEHEKTKVACSEQSYSKRVTVVRYPVMQVRLLFKVKYMRSKMVVGKERVYIRSLLVDSVDHILFQCQLILP